MAERLGAAFQHCTVISAAAHVSKMDRESSGCRERERERKDTLVRLWTEGEDTYAVEERGSGDTDEVVPFHGRSGEPISVPEHVMETLSARR